MFGKIINNTLILAPRIITTGGLVHYHPDYALYKSLGYLPITETPYPEDPEKSYSASYEEKDGRIIKIWTETDNLSYSDTI